MWLLRTVNTANYSDRSLAAVLIFFFPSLVNRGSYSYHHEGCWIYVRPEEQGRQRGHGALPGRPEPEHLQVQDPAAGRADGRSAAGHEQLLQ